MRVKSWKHKLQLMRQGIGEVHRMQPGFLIVSVMRALLSALSGYIGIYFSSKIINELASPDREQSQVILYVILTIGSTLLCTLANQAMGQLFDCFRYVIRHKKGAKITEKCNQMNYADMEDAKMNELCSDVGNEQFGDLVGISHTGNPFYSAGSACSWNHHSSDRQQIRPEYQDSQNHGFLVDGTSVCVCHNYYRSGLLLSAETEQWKMDGIL